MDVTLPRGAEQQTRRQSSKIEPAPLKFGPKDGFHQALKQTVDDYFETTGLPRRDVPAMYLKTAIILAWFIASYVLLVFVAPVWWLSVPLIVSLGLSVAAIGFNIQHDGNHGAYSNRRWVNKLMAMTLDLIGGSSYVWARKHNAIHHSFTNVAGHDDDINVGLLGRLAPEQRRLKFHRIQHWYLWLLYGFLPVKWQLVDDFKDMARGRMGGHSFPRPKGWDLVVFIGGKLTFFSLAFGIPMLLHPVWLVLAVYGGCSLVQGVILSVVFQMAHCVEEAEFPMPSPPTFDRMDSSWAAHQVETTVDFARDNKLLSWYIGGLNFQVEHHLFPHVCHVHFAALAKRVEQVCHDFGVRYRVNRTFRSGIASHYRWLKRMGMPVAA